MVENNKDFEDSENLRALANSYNFSFSPVDYYAIKGFTEVTKNKLLLEMKDNIDNEKKICESAYEFADECWNKIAAALAGVTIKNDATFNVEEILSICEDINEHRNPKLAADEFLKVCGMVLNKFEEISFTARDFQEIPENTPLPKESKIFTLDKIINKPQKLDNWKDYIAFKEHKFSDEISEEKKSAFYALAPHVCDEMIKKAITWAYRKGFYASDITEICDSVNLTIKKPLTGEIFEEAKASILSILKFMAQEDKDLLPSTKSKKKEL